MYQGENDGCTPIGCSIADTSGGRASANESPATVTHRAPEGLNIDADSSRNTVRIARKNPFIVE